MLSTTIEGAAAIKRKLDQMLDPAEDEFKKLVDFVHKEAQRRAKPHSWNKGTLGKVIKVDFAPAGRALEAKVSLPRAVVGIGRTIEEGRKPGKPPPVSAIKRWAEAGGITTKPWTLVQIIRRRGTKGIYFMAGAAEAGEKKAKEILKSTAAAIERAWGR